MNSGHSVLVFPAGMARSESFRTSINSIGVPIVEASSDKSQVSSNGYRYLPYITADDFLSEFVALLKAEGISRVYAPHPGVWWKLKALSEEPTFPVKFQVVNEQPHGEDRSRQEHAYAWAATCVAAEPFAENAAAPLAINRYANLYWGYSSIPGESDDSKIWLLTQVFRHAMPGDVVEIGSAYGRSAFALAWLAAFHQTGAVVCVDPWDLPSSSNQGAGASIINQAVLDVDWQAVYRSCMGALSGFTHVNYIRRPSAQAIADYKGATQCGYLETPEFGRTALSGAISVLHIDGNHRYEDVSLDIATWVPLVKPGGWILLDDYLWAFGDGPQRAGDELLQKVRADLAFAVGDTLCIRLEPSQGN